MPYSILEIISWFFLLSGSFLIITGALGTVRFPDFYTRMHAAGITDSLGAPLVLVSLAVQDGLTLFSGKIILLILFLLITGPTSTHALARAAMLSGLKPFRKEKN